MLLSDLFFMLIISTILKLERPTFIINVLIFKSCLYYIFFAHFSVGLLVLLFSRHFQY